MLTLIINFQMNTNYLTAIFRTQFNLFYRYGYTYIPFSQMVAFDGEVNDEAKAKIVELFKSITPFEYDEDYLILHLDTDGERDSSNLYFEIQNLVSVFPISQQAKISIESKIDQRIKLEQPIFESVLPQIERGILEKEIRKAIDALWLVCNLEDGKDEILSAIGIENILQGMEFRKVGTKAFQIKRGSYWNYLMAYDRFDYFPNSILGYFYDAGQVFAYSKNHRTFEGSKLHKFLQEINSQNPNIKFTEVITLLEESERVKDYRSQTTINNIQQYFIAPLYLVLKDEIRNADHIDKTKLGKDLRHLLDFGDNFKVAVILLGAFFGYKKFFDAYYDKLGLRFYKSFNEEPPTRKVENEEMRSNEIIVEALAESESETRAILISPDEKLSISQGNVEQMTIKDENLAKDYQQIVFSILKERGELKISELAYEFNKISKRKINNSKLLGILEEMKDKVSAKFKEKRIDKVMLKGTTLFDTQK